MTAQKWKYEVIRYAASYRDSKIELLDKKGQEGWELVNAHYLPSGEWELIFKRPTISNHFEYGELNGHFEDDVLDYHYEYYPG